MLLKKKREIKDNGNSVSFHFFLIISQKQKVLVDCAWIKNQNKNISVGFVVCTVLVRMGYTYIYKLWGSLCDLGDSVYE